MSRLLAGVVIVLAPLVATAATAADVGIRYAVFVPASADTPAHIEVVFEALFDTQAAVDAAQDTTKYRVLDLFGGGVAIATPSEVEVTAASVPATEWVPARSSDTVRLHVALTAAADNRYLVIVSGLKIGATQAPVTSAPTTVSRALPRPTAATPSWGKAKGKDTADVYVSGSLSRTANDRFYGNADVKLRYPIVERPFGDRLHRFAPTFDLVASDNPEADPNSMRAGINWQFFPIQALAGWLPATRWENAFEHESSRDFEYRTMVWRSELLFLPPPVPIGTGRFWISPTVGFAAGAIRQTPAGTVDAGPFSRLLTGATATFEIPTFFGKMLTLNAEYAYRRQLQDELVGPRTVASGVHQWRRASAEIAFNDFVAFGAVFQDGEQPPVYKRVTRSLVFDLTFKAARK